MGAQRNQGLDGLSLQPRDLHDNLLQQRLVGAPCCVVTLHDNDNDTHASPQHVIGLRLHIMRMSLLCAVAATLKKGLRRSE